MNNNLDKFCAVRYPLHLLNYVIQNSEKKLKVILFMYISGIPNSKGIHPSRLGCEKHSGGQEKRCENR